MVTLETQNLVPKGLELKILNGDVVLKHVDDLRTLPLSAVLTAVARNPAALIATRSEKVDDRSAGVSGSWFRGLCPGRSVGFDDAC